MFSYHLIPKFQCLQRFKEILQRKKGSWKKKSGVLQKAYKEGEIARGKTSFFFFSFPPSSKTARLPVSSRVLPAVLRLPRASLDSITIALCLSPYHRCCCVSRVASFFSFPYFLLFFFFTSLPVQMCLRACIQTGSFSISKVCWLGLFGLRMLLQIRRNFLSMFELGSFWAISSLDDFSL